MHYEDAYKISAKLKWYCKFTIFMTLLLGDLGGKIFKRAWWPRRFFVEPAKARTVTTEQLVA